MKRALLWIVTPIVLLLVLLVVVANVIADPASDLPPPDPSLVITLPDGDRVPLGELVARSRGSRDAEPPAPAGPATGEPADATAADDGIEVVQGEDGDTLVRFTWPPPVDPDDVFSLGRHAMRDGRTEEALALLQSVPEDHPQYSRAQRYIGWELLTLRMDKPGLGLAYMNRALDARPLDGENWQDASRVYLRTLGVRWDPVTNRVR